MSKYVSGFYDGFATLAQNITYKGVVVDESGEPIIGAP